MPKLLNISMQDSQYYSIARDWLKAIRAQLVEPGSTPAVFKLLIDDVQSEGSLHSQHSKSAKSSNYHILDIFRFICFAFQTKDATVEEKRFFAEISKSVPDLSQEHIVVERQKVIVTVSDSVSEKKLMAFFTILGHSMDFCTRYSAQQPTFIKLVLKDFLNVFAYCNDLKKRSHSFQKYVAARCDYFELEVSALKKEIPHKNFHEQFKAYFRAKSEPEVSDLLQLISRYQADINERDRTHDSSIPFSEAAVVHFQPLQRQEKELYEALMRQRFYEGFQTWAQKGHAPGFTPDTQSASDAMDTYDSKVLGTLASVWPKLDSTLKCNLIVKMNLLYRYQAIAQSAQDRLEDFDAFTLWCRNQMNHYEVQQDVEVLLPDREAIVHFNSILEKQSVVDEAESDLKRYRNASETALVETTQKALKKARSVLKQAKKDAQAFIQRLKKHLKAEDYQAQQQMLGSFQNLWGVRYLMEEILKAKEEDIIYVFNCLNIFVEHFKEDQKEVDARHKELKNKIEAYKDKRLDENILEVKQDKAIRFFKILMVVLMLGFMASVLIIQSVLLSQVALVLTPLLIWGGCYAGWGPQDKVVYKQILMHTLVMSVLACLGTGLAFGVPVTYLATPLYDGILLCVLIAAAIMMVDITAKQGFGTQPQSWCFAQITGVIALILGLMLSLIFHLPQYYVAQVFDVSWLWGLSSVVCSVMIMGGLTLIFGYADHLKSYSNPWADQEANIRVDKDRPLPPIPPKSSSFISKGWPIPKCLYWKS